MTLKNIHRSAAIISFICLGLLRAQDTPSQNRLSIGAETGGSQVTLNALQQKRADSGAVNAQGGALAVLSQAEVNSVVQQLESAYVSAYNRGDAKAAAELYTEGATVLGEFGALRQGREDIHTTLSFAFAQTARPRIEDTTRQSAAISNNVIVTHGTSHVTPPDTSRQPVDIFYTKVLTREGDQWRIAAAQFAQPNPWTVTFPATTVGSAAAKTFTLTNIGTTELNTRNISLSGKAVADYGEINTCSGPIPPSGSCTVTVTFNPKSIGRRSGELTFFDDGATGRHVVKLAGSGQ